jgi:hypothetical protein
LVSHALSGMCQGRSCNIKRSLTTVFRRLLG